MRKLLGFNRQYSISVVGVTENEEVHRVQHEMCSIPAVEITGNKNLSTKFLHRDIPSLIIYVGIQTHI